MQKGNILIFLLVGIVVLAAIGGAFYLGRSTTSKPSPNPVVTSQTPQSTPASSSVTDASPVPNGTGETANPDSIGANWKTYTNDKYKIFFKYPVDWKQKPADWDGITLNRDTGRMLEIKFSSSNSQAGLTIVTALSKSDLVYGHGLENMKEVAKNSVKVDAFEAELTTAETATENPNYKTGDPVYVFYGVIVKDKPLIVEYSGEKSKASLQEFDQILSTFRFTQ